MMDVFTLVEGYMNRLFSGIDGMKLLLVDRETVNNLEFILEILYI